MTDVPDPQPPAPDASVDALIETVEAHLRACHTIDGEVFDRLCCEPTCAPAREAFDAIAARLREAERERDEARDMLKLCAENTAYADLRQEIEFKRTAITEALDVLEDRTACHCHIWVEFPRIQEIKGPTPPRACPRCKAIDKIRGEFAGWYRRHD